MQKSRRGVRGGARAERAGGRQAGARLGALSQPVLPELLQQLRPGALKFRRVRELRAEG